VTINFDVRYELTLRTPVLVEPSSAGATYTVGGVNVGQAWVGPIATGTSVQSFPPPGYFFVRWTDGVSDNPRTVSTTFNPSVRINFDLPEPSQVSLVVYDVLGRKVAELENAIRDAGYHSVTWNAIEVASGVYLARFTATGASGNVKLSKVNKLLLTK
jgi:hypothetical protein